MDPPPQGFALLSGIITYMKVNKKVEKAAELIRMTSPDFTVAKSYFLAFEIVEALKAIEDEEVREVP